MTKSEPTQAKSTPEAPPPTPRARQLVIACFLATIALTTFDLWSKDWALANLSTEPLGQTHEVCEVDSRGYIYPQRASGTPITVIDDHLELHYAENCGAAFGMLRDAPSIVRHAVFGIAAIAASVVLFWMFISGRGGPPFAWAVPFIVSGALGNLADRFRLGYVVDFIRYYWHDPLPYLGTQWPTFNVADITISIGVGLLIIDGIQEARREKARLAESESDEKPKAAKAS